MRSFFYFSLIFVIFLSCEKAQEIQYIGYFNGTVHGNIVISEVQNNKYYPSIGYSKSTDCSGVYRLRLSLASKTSFDSLFIDKPIITMFTLDGNNGLQNKKTYKLLKPFELLSSNCDNLPNVSQFLLRSPEYIYYYTYIPHKDNYLQIQKVTDEYMEGHFKIRFIRTQFLEQGIASFDKYHLPDSMFIDCKKFIAPFRD